MPVARFVLVLLLVALAGCGEVATQTEPAPTAAPTPVPTLERSEAQRVPMLEPSEPFGLAEVTLRGPDGQQIALPVYDAADPDTRRLGLMDREELPDGTGMVFRFPADHAGGFYMFRTRMPLSIAFYDAEGAIVSVLDMDPCAEREPQACETYAPGVPYRGAIEVDQGWFDAAGVGEGWHVEVPSDLPQPS
jgi:uncharacterized protein